ncbi:MAG: choice-of-anchor J domain-containing protein, partial [bacterium]|nr:choice-of-anchor J domain-containing protein [bacterium]
MRFLSIILSILVLCLAPIPVSAQEPVRLLPEGSTAGDLFGAAVSVSGDLAVVGAPAEGNQKGAAYVFQQVDGTWAQRARLVAGDGMAGDQFGFSVYLNGDLAVVGAPLAGNGAGAVYVFERSGENWSEQTRLEVSSGDANGSFGFSLALSGDFLLIGAPRAEDEAGVAYIFRRAGGSWAEDQKLAPNDAVPGDNFGFSVSISGSNAVVGAPFAADAIGLIYVFQKGGVAGEGGAWVQVAALTPDEEGAFAFAGVAVAIENRTLVAGTLNEAAYVFKKSGVAWSQTARLAAKDGSEAVNFGQALALGGNTIVVGAPLDGQGAGAIYLFERATAWEEVRKFTPSGEGAIAFGSSISLQGDRIVSGAPATESGDAAGSAFVLSASALKGNASDVVLLNEGFDRPIFPPPGWTKRVTNSAHTWSQSNPQDLPFSTINPRSEFSAVCPWVTEDQEEWMVSPEFSLDNGPAAVEFFAGYSTAFPGNATLKLNISTDSGGSWTQVWEMQDDGAGWGWRKVAVNLSEYAEMPGLKLGWQYAGNDGDLVAIDAVVLKGPQGSAVEKIDAPAFILGDVNGDGFPDLGDALMVLAFDVGLEDLTAEQLAAADVNGSGGADLGDALLILQFDVGLITAFSKPALASSALGSVDVQLFGPESQPDGTLVLTVVLDPVDDTAGGSLILSYDPAAGLPVDVRLEGFSPGVFSAVNTREPGRVRVSFIEPSG